MGKNKRANLPNEDHLLLPSRSGVGSASIIDTHTHVASTFAQYRGKYREGKYENAFDFIRAMFKDRNIEAVIDVWCEAPVQKIWREFADSALTAEIRERNWAGTQYWFVMGKFSLNCNGDRVMLFSSSRCSSVSGVSVTSGGPYFTVSRHEAKLYSDAVEAEILNAMAHPRCVGWGEIGLDYHYDNSPRDVQRAVFSQQLKQAVKLGKPLTIHTREAEEDTEQILKLLVPKEHKIHVHCFTDSPDFAQRLLDHFPNLYIGITGVITYSTNLNTSITISQMFSKAEPFRFLLETDAPYMVPANLYSTLTDVKGKLPLSHSAMIPWTADFIAGIAGGEWDAAKIMNIARENAKKVYGV